MLNCLPRTRARIALATATALAVLPLAACGSDSEAASSDAGSSSTSAAALPVLKAAHDLLPADIASAGVITVGTRDDSPPNVWKNDDGQIVGYEYDLMNDLQQLLGVKFDYTYGVAFDSLVPSMQAKRFEVAFGSLGTTPDRQPIVDFVPWTAFHNSFMGRAADNLSLTSADQLCGMSVSATEGGGAATRAAEQSEKCVAAGKPKIDLQTYATTSEDVLAVQSGRAQLFAGPGATIDYTVAQSNGTFEKVFVDTSEEPIAFGVSALKGLGLGPAFAAAINYLIAQPQYQDILKKWDVEDGAITKSVVNPPEA